ncbi:MAG: hypothetical protein AN484_25905 [Aphanizomenon flos-aquae WA102]|uniref:Uncharacterized protein n=1 Tax=Aphanizomenon flos-aquae WA102 TaxID=1710896 RepID=A0A1B7WGG6_APHFL|nr:MAG: hypothetical protein AN484_25905 [Aphanizomenon flos-aquae WA102]
MGPQGADTGIRVSELKGPKCPSTCRLYLVLATGYVNLYCWEGSPVYVVAMCGDTNTVSAGAQVLKSLRVSVRLNLQASRGEVGDH